MTHFVQSVERQTNSLVNAMQTDGGKEFFPFKQFFQNKGISHKITCPHTSKQNGLIEINIETDLTLFAQTSVPLKF